MVLGLGVGFVALKVFVNVLQKAKGSPTEQVSMVCANTNIEPTLEITDSMVEVRRVTKDSFPETGFHDKSEVLGRVTTWPIPKGMPIAAMQLAPKGTPPGMAVRIEEGYRAVAVKIDESAGVAGWIKPGSRVDVVALLASPDRTRGNQSISKVILQNIQVLAVGQEIGKAGDTAAAVTNTVTLLVSPNDVPKIHLAETKGKLRLAMRGQKDDSVARDYLTTDNDLLSFGSTGNSVSKESHSSLLGSIFGGQDKVDANQTDKDKQPVAVAAAKPVPTESWTVEVYKGPTEVETVKFEREAKTWRRIDDRGQRSSPAPRSAPSPASVSLFAPRPPQAVATGTVNANQPQAKGSGTEGPAGIQ
jgi:pilus assembly protein CpaB